MKPIKNYELRAKFDAGLQIVGENFFGQLEWIGSDAQWNDAGLNKYHAELDMVEKDKWEAKREEMIENEVNDLIYKK